MQYGRSDALEGDNGTIIRYGNFPDHPDTPLHHKHTADGGIEAVDFDGLLALYRRFKQEVRDYDESGTEKGETDDEHEHRDRHIRFGTGNTERVEETVAARDRGEDPTPSLERVCRDVNSLPRVTRPNNLELLRILATEHPESIRETARLVDHDVRQVHRNLEELDSQSLIEFQSDGPGKPKHPIVWYDEISIELPLSSWDGESGDRAKA